MKNTELASLLRRLERPSGPVDVVLDTDTFNEVDDQFALSYLLASQEKLKVQALYAAPFFNEKSSSPEDGMLKSYEEILRLLKLCHAQELEDRVFQGSRGYLPDEKTPVASPAAEDLARRDMDDVPIDESNYDELTRRIDAYIDEFERNGTDNIVVESEP